MFLAAMGLGAGSGSGWSIIPSPNLTSEVIHYSDAYLRSIACPSASECWSVGYSIEHGQGGYNKPLIVRWSGSSWSLANGAPINSYSTFLNGVTCVSEADCWVVGSYLNEATHNYQTLAEHWNGTSWQVVDSENPGSPTDNSLAGVSCASSSDCWAVGSSGGSGIAEHWDGTAWTLVSLPVGATPSHDITCVGASDCWAVGEYFGGPNPVGYKTRIEHWDGATWSVVSSPNGDPAQYDNNYLNGIACTSSSDCWAVGFSNNAGTGVYATLLEHWNGTTWSIVPAPSTTSAAIPQRVACASSSDCWLSGNLGAQTLVEHWDGNGWSVMPSQNPDVTQINRFHGVVCISGNDCWASGEYFYFQGNAYQTLFEHWNGWSWAIAPSENPNTSLDQAIANELHSVTCVSDSDCWAVGYARNAGYSNLIEHWDGNAWTVVGSPDIAAASSQLNGVTCTSALDCWAVGGSTVPVGSTVILHWDGVSWSSVNSPRYKCRLQCSSGRKLRFVLGVLGRRLFRKFLLRFGLSD